MEGRKGDRESGSGRKKGRQGPCYGSVMRGYERLTRKEHMQARRAQVSISTCTGLSNLQVGLGFPIMARSM